ncbi:MAG: carboxypeptidase regulatory-like domain-containing protein [Sedimentisphaerales bacterium]|nr:carboxypeptidase regulatory-like domain-containing protein [Sedimentisphaerales bacterium]
MEARIYKVTKLLLIVFCICNFSNAEGIQKLPITGQVVDYMARPVEGAEVAIIGIEHINNEYMSKTIAPIVKTNKDGRFEVQANVTSQYDTYIIARKKGMAYAWDGLNYSRNTLGKGKFLLVLEKANTLTGKVVDYNGKAVSGATVQAVPKTSYLSRLNQRPIYGPKEWFTTETDSEGVFSFGYFSEDSSADFRVKAKGWNCTYKFTTHIQNCCGFEVWRSDIKLVLPQETKIKGNVVEESTGKSVDGVELLIQKGSDREDIVNCYLPVSVKTGKNGSFVCEGIPVGNHTIELVTEESQTADWTVGSVKFSVSPNQSTENIQVKVRKGGIIEYTVLEYNSEKFLPQVYVSSYNDNCHARTVTNKQGITRHRVLPGEYKAYSGLDGYVSWQVNEPVIVKDGEVTKVNIELTKSPTISGTVVDTSGKPAQNVLVTVHPFGDHIYTDKEGQFTAWYEDRYADSGLYIIARDTQNSLAAILHTKDLENPVKLSLSPALTVKGKIADPNGNGISAARMSLGMSYAYCLSQLGADTLTDTNGLFEFKAIPLKQSDFNFWQSTNSTGFAPKAYQRITIDGEPGTTFDVGTIKLKPADLSVSGTVVDANGIPEPHAIIFVNGLVGAEQPEKRTATDENGQFIIKGVSADQIRLQANFDSDSGSAGFTTAHGGDKDIKIVLGQKLVHTPHQSLLGKSLPDISKLGIKLEETKDKAVLVCFFDYEQRPSRNGILELSKKAKELKSKDIEIIAVHTSKIEKEYLDKWLKENGIDFPVGMIKENEEQTKFNWGIKALPWLILTDKEYIVKAEGFSINELDENIKTQ